MGGKNGKGADLRFRILGFKRKLSHFHPSADRDPREQRWPSGSRRQMRDHSGLNPLTKPHMPGTSISRISMVSLSRAGREDI